MKRSQKANQKKTNKQKTPFLSLRIIMLVLILKKRIMILIKSNKKRVLNG
jgi:hypothetical protein